MRKAKSIPKNIKTVDQLLGTTDIADLLARIHQNRSYMKGIVVVVLDNDGTPSFEMAGTINKFEALGLLECGKSVLLFDDDDSQEINQ
jgi:hypothetical protein